MVGDMTLEIRILNLKLAFKENRAKGIVRYKFRKYMEEYDNHNNDVIDKRTHRDLALEYFRYMIDNGERE
jgi:hypothetical protein